MRERQGFILVTRHATCAVYMYYFMVQVFSVTDAQSAYSLKDFFNQISLMNEDAQPPIVVGVLSWARPFHALLQSEIKSIWRLPDKYRHTMARCEYSVVYVSSCASLHADYSRHIPSRRVR